MSTCQEENRCILDGPSETTRTSCCFSTTVGKNRWRGAIQLSIGADLDVAAQKAIARTDSKKQLTLLWVLFLTYHFYTAGKRLSLARTTLCVVVADDSADAAPAVRQQCCWQIRQNKTGPTHLFNPGFRLNRCFNVDACKKSSEMYVYPTKTNDMTINKSPS